MTQSIGNWQLEACNTDGSEVLLTTIPAGTVLQPKGQVGQCFLVANCDGYSGATPADLCYSGASIHDLGGVKLLNGVGTEIDAVGFTDGLDCTETCPAMPQTAAENPVAVQQSSVEHRCQLRGLPKAAP